MVAHSGFQRCEGAIVHPWTGDGNITQRRGAEGVTVAVVAGFTGTPQVKGFLFAFAITNLWDGDVVKFLIGQQACGMTSGATCFAINNRALFGLIGKRGVIALNIAIIGTIFKCEDCGLVCRERICRVLES